jgi:hypothetical protein
MERFGIGHWIEVNGDWKDVCKGLGRTNGTYDSLLPRDAQVLAYITKFILHPPCRSTHESLAINRERNLVCIPNLVTSSSRSVDLC